MIFLIYSFSVLVYKFEFGDKLFNKISKIFNYFKVNFTISTAIKEDIIYENNYKI